MAIECRSDISSVRVTSRITTAIPAYCDTGYCDTGYCDTGHKTVTKRLKNEFYHTVKLSDIVTIGYCDTFSWSQHCHNDREALYLEFQGIFNSETLLAPSPPWIFEGRTMMVHAFNISLTHGPHWWPSSSVLENWKMMAALTPITNPHSCRH